MNIDINTNVDLDINIYCDICGNECDIVRSRQNRNSVELTIKCNGCQRNYEDGNKLIEELDTQLCRAEQYVPNNIDITKD